MKKFVLAAAAAVIVLGAVQHRASAQPISRHNPYRAFNHTGSNYGAQQWEKRQARSSSGQNYVRSGSPGASSYAGTPGRWSYNSAYRGVPAARPAAPNCR